MNEIKEWKNYIRDILKIDMYNEIWRPIVNDAVLYKISNFGIIKSLPGERGILVEKILKQYNLPTGHLYVSLFKKGIHKKYFTHRLVLETFIGPCPPGMECRHLDGNPKNNRLDNLKWGTRSENCQDAIKHNTKYRPNHRGTKNNRAKIDDKKALEIKKLIQEGKLKNKEIALECRVTLNIVKNIKYCGVWGHIKIKDTENIE